MVKSAKIAALAFLLAAPIPAHADISSGDLMYTDLFQWQGQYGTLNWREILEFYDCTAQLGYYLNNVPEPPALPPVIPPPIEPPPCVACDGPPPPIPTPVPETSTWLMLIAGLAAIALRRRTCLALVSR